MLSDNSMRKSFKDSLKVLEADIQHANSLYVVLLFSQFFFFASFLERKKKEKRKGWWRKRKEEEEEAQEGGRGRSTEGEEEEEMRNTYVHDGGVCMCEKIRDSFSFYTDRLDQDWSTSCFIPRLTEQRYHCRNSRSRSCPFCRNSLTRVNSGDLWMFIENRDVVDMEMVSRENIRRLIMYIKKLPEIVSETVSDPYDSHLR
ncbi:hypothetical protein BHM03_00005105 [Ensete ventricosum]|nr:hypothetical protein BHM03_00005105 [Ensete ventricosum]